MRCGARQSYWIFWDFRQGSSSLPGRAFSRFAAPLLRETTGVASPAVPGYLLAFGVGGVIGMQVGGRFADRNALAALIAVCGQCCGQLWPRAAGRFPNAWASSGGHVHMGFQPIFRRRADSVARRRRGARSAQSRSTLPGCNGLNAGIAAGPLFGAAGLRGGMTYGDLPLIAAALALAALGAAVWSAVLDRRGSASALSRSSQQAETAS